MHTANELLLVAGCLVALAAPVVPGRLCVLGVENPGGWGGPRYEDQGWNVCGVCLGLDGRKS